MIKINVAHNFPQVSRELAKLREDIANKAMARALNATVDQGKIQMARSISQEFRLSVSEVKARLAVHKAVARGQFMLQVTLEATRKGKGRSMNLIAFVTGKETAGGAKSRLAAGGVKLSGRGAAKAARQIAFQVKRSGGKKIIPGAFIGNKGRTLFIRTGKARLPIKALNTIDVQQMFNTRRINQAIVASMLQNFPKNFERELRAVRGGWIK